MVQAEEGRWRREKPGEGPGRKEGHTGTRGAGARRRRELRRRAGLLPLAREEAWQVEEEQSLVEGEAQSTSVGS